MITRKDAIAIGQAIIFARNKEIRISRQLDGDLDLRRVGANGTAYDAIQNIWHDVFPNRVKESFNYDVNTFHTTIGYHVD